MYTNTPVSLGTENTEYKITSMGQKKLSRFDLKTLMPSLYDS